MSESYYQGQRFDEWIKLTEANLTGEALGVMRKMQRDAKLFTWDDESFVAGADRLDTFEDLHLPFKVTALELQSRIVCITDGEASSQWVVQAMLHGPEGSNVIIGLFIDKATFSHQLESASYFKNGQFMGKFHDKEKSGAHAVRYADETVDMTKIALAILNCRDRFILEQIPKPTGKKNTGKHAKRAAWSTERPRYTVIDPTTIRQRMRLVETGVKRRGHDVRGHWRVYRSERYTEMRGKSQWIEAHWAGPTENVVDGVTYRVRIDK